MHEQLIGPYKRERKKEMVVLNRKLDAHDGLMLLFLMILCTYPRTKNTVGLSFALSTIVFLDCLEVF